MTDDPKEARRLGRRHTWMYLGLLSLLLPTSIVLYTLIDQADVPGHDGPPWSGMPLFGLIFLWGIALSDAIWSRREEYVAQVRTFGGRSGEERTVRWLTTQQASQRAAAARRRGRDAEVRYDLLGLAYWIGVQVVAVAAPLPFLQSWMAGAPSLAWGVLLPVTPLGILLTTAPGWPNARPRFVAVSRWLDGRKSPRNR
jgi:hypothetical protein